MSPIQASIAVGSSFFWNTLRFLGLSEGVAANRTRRTKQRFVGIDVAPSFGSSERKLVLPLWIASLLAALFLVGLRIDLIRMEYAHADALSEVQRLDEEKRTVTVEMRQLRDPARLAERAREFGFGNPERYIDIVVPAGTSAGTPSRVGGARP